LPQLIDIKFFIQMIILVLFFKNSYTLNFRNNGIITWRHLFNIQSFIQIIYILLRFIIIELSYNKIINWRHLFDIISFIQMIHICIIRIHCQMLFVNFSKVTQFYDMTLGLK